MSQSSVTNQNLTLGDAELFVRRGHSSPGAQRLPTLVFLHDSLGCVETWRDFPQALAQSVGLDWLVYDRRGYGQSSPFGSEPRTNGYLEAEAVVLFELLDALTIEQVILFGHSDGGSISLVAAAERPKRVRAVLTEGAHVFVEEEALAGIRAAQTALVSTDLRDRLRRYHGDKVDGVTSAWIDTWLSPRFRTWSIESYLPNVSCPMLVIQGVADEFGTQAQVEAIVSNAAEAQSLIIPGIGHTPHREARATVIDAATRFIGSAMENSPPAA